MDVGDLVIVRLDETGNMRYLLPGVIIGKLTANDRPMYEVLTRGETVTVSDIDLGPIDLLADKERLEQRWNESEDV